MKFSPYYYLEMQGISTSGHIYYHMGQIELSIHVQSLRS